jgi:hypothetical protein
MISVYEEEEKEDPMYIDSAVANVIGNAHEMEEEDRDVAFETDDGPRQNASSFNAHSPERQDLLSLERQDRLRDSSASLTRKHGMSMRKRRRTIDE